jgi:hypothetical protein
MNVRERWLRLGNQAPTNLLELAVCLCIFVAMTGVAAHTVGRVEQHVRVLEAVSLASGSRIAMMETHAVTGEWRASSLDLLSGKGGNFIGRMRLELKAMREGGAIDYQFSDRAGDLSGRVLTFRAWQAPGTGESPVAWLCGHASAVAMTAASDDRTTLSEVELPSPCRARK